jgi:hypothetical protein
MFECKMSLQYVPDFGKFLFAQGSGPDSPKYYTACSYEVRVHTLPATPSRFPAAQLGAVVGGLRLCSESAVSPAYAARRCRLPHGLRPLARRRRAL